MDSPGCFMAALRASFESIRRRIRERGVRQRQRNYRVSKIQTIEKVDQKRGRGLNKRVTSEELKSSPLNPKGDLRRACLVASGWRPRQENGEALRRQAQEKMDATLQERRKPLRVHRGAPQVQVMNHSGCGDTNANPLTLSCVPLTGKKACSQRWEDLVLEGMPVSQDNTRKCCVPLNGKKACSQRWQGMVLENLRLAGQLPVPLNTTAVSTSNVLGETGNDHQMEEAKAENQEQSEAHGGDLLDQAETHRDTFTLRLLEPVWLGPEWAKRKKPLYCSMTK